MFQFIVGRRDDQFCVNLIRNATDEIGRGNLIDRDCDRSSQDAAQKCRYPLRGIASAEQHALSRSDAASLQLARKLRGGGRHCSISPRDPAISLPLDEKNLIATPVEFREVFNQRGGGRGILAFNHLHSRVRLFTGAREVREHSVSPKLRQMRAVFRRRIRLSLVHQYVDRER